MQYKKLAFMITDRCNASCAFCGLSCSSKKHRVMSWELAKHLLDQAARLEFQRVSLSGGEPLLYPDLVIQILSYARELGIPERTIASNGFWGGWSEEKCEKIITDLKENVTHISLSHDAFHAEYVNTDDVLRLAVMLDRNEISTSIHVADVHGEKGAAAFLSSVGGKAMNQEYTLYPLSPYGRAKTLPKEIFIREYDWQETGCFPDGHIVVDPDGICYPCCSPGIFEAGFIIGDASKTPLAEILKGRIPTRYMSVLRHPSCFNQFLHFAREELHIEFPDKVSCGCDICTIIFSQPEILNRVKDYLEKEYKSLMMEKLLSQEADAIWS